MRKLLEQLEELHIRVAETASNEEGLVRALGEALARLDEQLLQDVRHIASEHQQRRTAILGELQGLAGRIGMFQVARQTAQIAYEDDDRSYALAGDWREATRKIAEEIEAPVDVGSRTLDRGIDSRSTLTSLADRRRRASGG